MDVDKDFHIAFATSDPRKNSSTKLQAITRKTWRKLNLRPR